ncbi:hypothetical protein GNF18_10305 [Ligilactobacillus pobuzihii]|uniref:hypothetical protein n=1 Tax=Ligilactobacillus pobuzihii TaxID=449659 RepID=UPI0019D015AF|nr:hypothetical protein [Ligilactobacillus pobuzihii]MBN7275532.1 hypothetical protein [Ligilactobacillus pobuzihii]
MKHRRKKVDRRKRLRRMKRNAEINTKRAQELREYMPHIPSYKVQARKIANSKGIKG